MADDLYIPVIDSDVAMKAIHGMIEIRRGYRLLVERLISPFPVAFRFDQKKRNQMITLISRSDTLWALFLIHSESDYAPRKLSGSARQLRKNALGVHLTRAAISRGLAVYESGNLAATVERRHTVAASRLVEAAHSFGLIEYLDKPDEKQKPIKGTKRLSNFLHALGDHAHWVMLDATTKIEPNSVGPLTGFSEAAARFDGNEKASRLHVSKRITSDDAPLRLTDFLS